MTSTLSRLRLASHACATYSGRPFTMARPSGVRAWPNLVVTTTWSRRPRIARPSNSSLWPKPYMSEESRKLTPKSRARCTTSMDCASSPLPYVPDMDMQPSPMAGTESELWPSVRYSMASPWLWPTGEVPRNSTTPPRPALAGRTCYNSGHVQLVAGPGRTFSRSPGAHRQPLGVPVQDRAEPGAPVRFLGQEVRRRQLGQGGVHPDGARAGQGGARAARPDHRPRRDRPPSPPDGRAHVRYLPAGLLRARVLGRPDPVHAQELLRHAALRSAPAHRRRQAAWAREPRRADDQRNATVLRLHADPGARLRDPPRRGLSADPHGAGPRHGARAALQDGVRLAIRGGRDSWPGPDTHRRHAEAPAGRSPRPRADPRDPAARFFRVPGLHDLQGDRGHRSGGAVLARAGPDRQGVDRVPPALPAAPGQAADALPAARAALRAGRARRRPGAGPQLRRRVRARVHLRRLPAPQRRGSEERRVGKECRSRWSPYH